MQSAMYKGEYIWLLRRIVDAMHAATKLSDPPRGVVTNTSKILIIRCCLSFTKSR